MNSMVNMMQVLRKGIVVLAVVLFSCSGIDINDDLAVLQDIQGTWIGYEKTGDFYRHVKLYISDNTFNGWLQTTESAEEPTWTVLPNENGTFSLSAVLNNTGDSKKYRKFNFFIRGRCCGDNSLTARTLSGIIAYEEGKGMRVFGGESLVKR
jgi:hypothetical protein